MLFLAGDIGGTKALLQLSYNPPEIPYGLETYYDSAHSKLPANHSIQIAKQRYECAEFDSLESIINHFLSKALSAENLVTLTSAHPCLGAIRSNDLERIQSACFGLPGPVNGRIVELTNLPWKVDAQKIEQACSIQSVHFVNDFYAAASGIESLSDEDVISLYSPLQQTTEAGNRLVVGAGTGLGVAPVFYDGQDYTPVPCEGGHFDFAPISETQQSLLTWLWQQWSHVSYERVLSGPGLEALYMFFKTFDYPNSYVIENNEDSAGLKKQTLKSDLNKQIDVHIADNIKSPLFSLRENTLKTLSAIQISQAAEAGDEIAIKAVTEFVTIYGAFVGAVSLVWHAPQGIYLAGGIATKILPWMQKPYFEKAFLEKGRMSKVVANMPVFIVMDEGLGLKGAMRQNYVYAKRMGQ